MDTNELYQTEEASQHSKVPYGYQKRIVVGKRNEKVEMNIHTQLCKIITKNLLQDEDP